MPSNIPLGVVSEIPLSDDDSNLDEGKTYGISSEGHVYGGSRYNSTFLMGTNHVIDVLLDCDNYTLSIFSFYHKRTAVYSLAKKVVYWHHFNLFGIGTQVTIKIINVKQFGVE